MQALHLATGVLPFPFAQHTEPLYCPLPVAQVKGAGPLLAYASQRPAAVLVDEWERVFAYDSATGALTFDLAASGNMDKRVELRFASSA